MKRRADGRLLKVMEYKRPDGTRYKKYFYAHEERDLYKQIAAYEVEQDAGPLFKEVAADWREEHYKRLVYNTQRGYEKSYKQAINHFGQQYIKSITPSMVNAYVLKFEKQGYASKTIASHLSVLRLIFIKSLIDGIISSNPAEHISVPAGLKKTKRKPPSSKEVEDIKNGLDKPFGLFAYFVLYSGLRKSEALALQWQDIDFMNREISVTKAWYTKNNKPYIKPFPKTDAGERVVPLLEPLEKVLKPQEPEAYVFGFPSEKKFRVQWDKYRDAIKAYCTTHQLRHEFCTILFEAGIDEFDAMVIMGHSDITTMRNIYTHLRNSRRAKITDTLNAKLISRKCEKCGTQIEGSPKFCTECGTKIM